MPTCGKYGWGGKYCPSHGSYGDQTWWNFTTLMTPFPDRPWDDCRFTLLISHKKSTIHVGGYIRIYRTWFLWVWNHVFESFHEKESFGGSSRWCFLGTISACQLQGAFGKDLLGRKWFPILHEKLISKCWLMSIMFFVAWFITMFMNDHLGSWWSILKGIRRFVQIAQ